MTHAKLVDRATSTDPASYNQAIGDRVGDQLVRLRRTGRYSVSVVDIACGAGVRLMQVARQARALGFTAIEARGLDRSAAMVALARMSATALRDPAIGLTFEIAEAGEVPAFDPDDPIDIVLHQPATIAAPL